MNKDKELEVVDSRKVEVDLMEKVVDLTVLCRIKENLNGRMMTKTRTSGKVVVYTEEVLVFTKEEVILILKFIFMVVVSDVVKRDTNILNVDALKEGKLTKIL